MEVLMATQHQWMQMIVTPVICVTTDEGSIMAPDPDGEEQVRYGCFACNMGVEEGMQLPCPGFDIFDEALAAGGAEG